MTSARYPQQLDCPACSRPILVTLNRRHGNVLLAFDPEPDGDGEHFDTVLAGDRSYWLASGDATAIGCKGRFPLYRAHAWTCPNRLTVPADGPPVPGIGGFRRALFPAR